MNTVITAGGIALLATLATASTLQVQTLSAAGHPAPLLIVAAAPAWVVDVPKPTATAVSAAAPALAAPAASATIVADVIRHDIAATTVDSTATQNANSQTGVPNKNLTLVPTSTAARNGKLALFILGTNSSETLEQEIVYAAAKRGYNAITVSYPNYNAVAALCASSSDVDCTAKVREEQLTGVDLSSAIAVAPKDAVETRLKNLLVYLRTTYPSEGWGTYLSGTTILWSKISAIGHSQGAGHVAYLGKLHALYRIAMVSGVADKTLAGATAPWLARTNVTPAASQYGFSNTADTTVLVGTADASWNAIGLAAFGALTSTDGVSAPYGNAHKLSTSLPPAAGATNVHLSMADDNKMPRNADGTAKYEPVWDYIAFP